MKKILYDNQMFTLQRFGGVTRYFASLMRNLPKDEFVSEIPMQYSENPYIRDINGNDYDKITLPLIYNIRHKIYRLVNKNIASDLKIIAKKLNTESILELIAKANKCKEMLNFNVNPTSVVDEFLYKLAEVKVICRRL